MATQDPTTTIDARFSGEGATPTPWPDGRRRLQEARVSWLTTVRPDGRPHATTLMTVWLDDALYFCTGDREQKARNLAQNPHCLVVTGTSAEEGLDVVVEGEAARVTDDDRLRRLADAWVAKYGPDWQFEVRDGAFHSGEGGGAHVYQVAPSTAFGFAKGDVSGQTRWRFDRP